MMIVKTMYEVTFGKEKWRICEDDIETFIHILLWNGKDNITIRKEGK